MQCESTFIKDLHIITRPFTFPYPHTTCIVLYSNPTLIYTVTNPDLYMGGGGEGGAVIHTYIHVHTYMFYLSAHQDPEIRWGGGGDLKKKFFWPFRRQFGPKLRGSPRPLPWIHHSYNNPSPHLVFLPLQIKNSVPKFFCAVGKICSQVKQGFPF